MSHSQPAGDETMERNALRAAMNREILETLRAKLVKNPSLNLHVVFLQENIPAKKKYFPNATAKLLQERHKPPRPTPQGFPVPLLRSTAKPVVLSPLSDAAKSLLFGAGEDDGVFEDVDSLDKGVRRVLEQGEVVTELLGRGGVLRCGDKSGLDIAIKVVPASMNGLKTEYIT